LSLDDALTAELGALAEQSLLRGRTGDPPADLPPVDVSSNDYLGYGRLPVSRETSRGPRTGAGASRLIFGTHPEHLALERRLADWVRAPGALLFASGYVANLSAISALVHPGDLIVSDQLNHASIIDGCRLARAKVSIVSHCDLEAISDALAQPTNGRRWVLTESYFSMEGDSPDLTALRDLCTRKGAYLMVDEAHALGVFGPQGAGLCARAGVIPEVLVGTLGKAVGAQGAFVAGSDVLCDFLWNRARGFVFSTAPSPYLCSLVAENVARAQEDESGRRRLGALCDRFEAALSASGVELPSRRHGPIFPVLVGSPERALRIARGLREHGFLAQAIRPPTVPLGASRVRITLHADLRDEDVIRLAARVSELCAGS
jgi:8-amino-7-oxononanoate synthase